MSEVSSAAPAAATTANVATTATEVAQTPEAKLQTLEQKPQTEQTKQEIKDLKRKLKVNVYGKEQEVEFDPSDDKYMTEMFSKAMGADKAFQEGATTKKQLGELVKALQDPSDMWEVMRQAGHNPDEAVMKYMERQIEEQAKSPQQKEFERIQKELDTERKRAKQLEEEKHSAENQRISDGYAREINQQIEEAFRDLKGLPQSAYTVRQLGTIMTAFMDKGQQISVKDAVMVLKSQNKNELQEMFSKMDEDDIEELLGEHNNKRLRARRVAKAKEVKAASQIKSTGISAIEKEINAQPQKKQSASDFFKKLS